MGKRCSVDSLVDDRTPIGPEDCSLVSLSGAIRDTRRSRPPDAAIADQCVCGFRRDTVVQWIFHRAECFKPGHQCGEGACAQVLRKSKLTQGQAARPIFDQPAPLAFCQVFTQLCLTHWKSCVENGKARAVDQYGSANCGNSKLGTSSPTISSYEITGAGMPGTTIEFPA